MPLNIVTDLWLPLVIAAVIGTLLLRSTRNARASIPVTNWDKVFFRGVGTACTLAAALAAMHVLIVGKPVWPPPGLTERLLPLFVVAGILGAAATSPRYLRMIAVLSFLTAAAAVAIAIWPMLSVPSESSKALPIAITLGVAGLAALSATSLAALDRDDHHLASGVILAGLGFACGGALLGSGNMKLAQFGLGLGIAILTLVVVITLAGKRSMGSGAPAVAVAILAALLVAANRYATLRPVPALLFALPAPLALLSLRFLERMIRPRAAALVAVIVAALLAGLATGLSVDLAGTTGAASSADDYGYGPQSEVRPLRFA